jgi:hypothetical protein
VNEKKYIEKLIQTRYRVSIYPSAFGRGRKRNCCGPAEDTLADGEKKAVAVAEVELGGRR